MRNLGLTLFLAISGVLNPTSVILFNTSYKNSALAQIIPDQTLGAESSVINPNVNIEGTLSDQIEGGAIRGTNLFHSFEEFNVREGQGAYFINPIGIERILSRVTGNSISQILGKLGVLGNADLFLINPNGIVFGPNATLDLKGSFLATTANSLIFEDGTQFSATDTSAAPLLTVSIPTGLQFRKSARSILNQSQGQGLGVQPGKTLALVGGNIIMQGGIIEVPLGRIELGSVAGTGQVHLQKIDSGWTLSYEDVQNFKDIELTQSPTSLETSILRTFSVDGEGGGSIQVKGRRVSLANGSQIAGNGANIVISASETVEVSGIASGRSTIRGPIFSGIGSVSPLTGKEGSVTINTKKLIVQNGGRITSNTNGRLRGDQLTTTTVPGGNLIVNASESVELKGGETETGLFSSTSSFGAAGNITINTQKLVVRDGATISAESTGVDLLGQSIETGQAGNININANSLSLNQGTITAETSQSGGKEGANITLKISDLLKIENESQISARANGSANGGNIDIKTPLLIVFPPTGSNGSDIIANAEGGNGGNITINAQGIFGIAERTESQENQSNDIDASSEFGASGQVEIDNTIDPNRGLVELPETVVDPNALVAQNACKRGSESEFVITGRGGLPPSLNEDLSSDATQVGLVEPAPIESRGAREQERREAEDRTSSLPSVPTPIVPAQGWVFNERGEVVLVAYDPTVTGSQRLRKNGEGCTSP